MIKDNQGTTILTNGKSGALDLISFLFVWPSLSPAKLIVLATLS
jgi:hypothetical protein